ncbi:MAG: hypothetical protein A2V62_06130 [Nitrospirae bacterium RBG_19FT_COMBO_58_9]|nr:MAG: hypothetical protein A2V62_06130 [Nitrospirae bacterium RBG_19FT_COMBO_58_9]
MRIADLYKRDTWYAKAILPILTDKRCNTITPYHEKKACCLINENRLLFVKKGKRQGKNTFYWLFAFTPEDRKFLAQEAQNGKCILLFLICENKEAPVVCAVKWNDAQNLLDCTAGWKQQNLYVRKKNWAYQLTGPIHTEQPPSGFKKGRVELLDYFYEAENVNFRRNRISP